MQVFIDQIKKLNSKGIFPERILKLITIEAIGLSISMPGEAPGIVQSEKQCKNSSLERLRNADTK